MARKVNVKIELNEKPVTVFSSLSLNQLVHGHHSFELRCPIVEQERSLVTAAQDYIGKEAKIEIQRGFGDSNATNFFIGVVTSVSLSKFQGSTIEIVYSGHGPTLLMDDGPHCQSFEKKSISQIADAVTGKYDIAKSIQPKSDPKIPYFVQYKESSFHFLNRLAALYGEWLYYDGKQLLFGLPEDESDLPLVFERDLFNFDLGLHLQPGQFKTLGYDYLAHKIPESPAGPAKVPGLDEYGKLVAKASDEVYKNEPLFSAYYDLPLKADLDDYTLFRKSAASGRQVIINGSSDHPSVAVGKLLKVTGAVGNVGEVDYGKFRVISVSHMTDNLGNYQNHFRAIPATLEKAPSNPLVSEPLGEIQAAEVMENNDPEKLGRVRVQFAWQKATDDKTDWIRGASASAGSTHGAYFVPEVGDEVLVGFEHQNPNKPYVLGSLYHGKSKPQGVADPDDNKKVIKTKSGNQIFFNDEGGKEEIKIENGTNVLLMTLSGSGKISISTKGDMELSAKNISLSAEQKISLNAQQQINIEAQQKLDMKGTTSASLSGTKVEINGQAQTQLSGANVVVNGQAMVDIKGAMVKLNS